MIRLKDTFFSKIKINDLEDISIPIPSILIWKLLISNEFSWKWFWKKIIMAIISYCYDISSNIWIRFIIVDSHKNAVWFYEKLWFIQISDSWKTIKMILDLKSFNN